MEGLLLSNSTLTHLVVDAVFNQEGEGVVVADAMEVFFFLLFLLSLSFSFFFSFRSFFLTYIKIQNNRKI